MSIPPYAPFTPWPDRFADGINSVVAPVALEWITVRSGWWMRPASMGCWAVEYSWRAERRLSSTSSASLMVSDSSRAEICSFVRIVNDMLCFCFQNSVASGTGPLGLISMDGTWKRFPGRFFTVSFSRSSRQLEFLSEY